MNHKHSKTNNQPRTTDCEKRTTKDYVRKINSFMQNEPNSNPIYEMPKMNVNKVSTKDYGKNSPGWLTKTNPIQTQFPQHNTQYAIRNTNPIKVEANLPPMGRRSLRASFLESSNPGPIRTRSGACPYRIVGGRRSLRASFSESSNRGPISVFNYVNLRNLQRQYFNRQISSAAAAKVPSADPSHSSNCLLFFQ